MRKWLLLRAAMVGVLFLGGCEPQAPTVAPPVERGGGTDFTFMLQKGTTTWFTGVDGRGAGFDYDLAQLFAHRQKRALSMLAAENPSQLLAATAAGNAKIGAGGLFRPPDKSAAHQRPKVLYSTGYSSVESVLIFNVDGFKPESWSDLDGETVGILEANGMNTMLDGLRAAHPEVKWHPLALSSADPLIEQVADGTLGYAVVASTEAAAAHNVYLNVDIAFPVGPKQDLVWVFPPSESRLRDEADAFFREAKRDGTLQRLLDLYFGYAKRVERADATVFQDRMRALLPPYRSAFRQGQDATGIDWRLLAAIAYQESHWDPLAISETNVRGMMMLTEETARRLKVTDRLDARQSIIAGARYVDELKRFLPQRIAEPDRTWLALAAFNVGVAHLQDARALAVKRNLNPDSWSDLKKTLPLLARPDIAEATKYGFARGGQAVVFVETVRAYYDVLARLEKPYYTVARAER